MNKTIIENYGYIYLILDQKENKVYVGQKKGLPENSENYFGSGTIIKNIIKKRGTYFLKKIILGFCKTREEILICEKECKYFFNAFDKKYGYNIAIDDFGGDLITHHPDKNNINKKHSNTLKKLWNTDNYRNKMMKSREFVWSDKVRDELSKKYSGSGNPMYGKKFSDQSKIKSRESQKNNKKEKHCRWIEIDLIKMVELKNNNYTYSEIGNFFNVDKQVIYKRFKDIKSGLILLQQTIF